MMLVYQEPFCGTMQGLAGFQASENDRRCMDEDVCMPAVAHAKWNGVEG
jgi:hypothetical protein